MRKVIHITIIILILIGLCLTEQLLSNKYLNELNDKTDELLSVVRTSEQVNTTEIANLADEITVYWTDKENVLCTFVNHKEIEDIGVELSKVKSSIANNDKDKLLESLDLIKFYIQSYRHFLEINFQNIF